MPLRNADRSSIGFELFVQVPGASEHTKIPNVVDIEFDFPAAPVESQKYVDGDASKFSGTADPATCTCNMSYNPASDEFKALALAKRSAGTLDFYCISGDEATLYPAQENKIEITTAGAVTFNGDGSKPNFGRRKETFGRYGAGDCIKIGSDYYRIVKLSGDPPNEVPVVKDFPHGGGADNVETAVAVAVAYSIVRPQLRLNFLAGVSALSGLGASPSSPAATGGQLVLEFQNASDEDWILVKSS